MPRKPWLKVERETAIIWGTVAVLAFALVLVVIYVTGNWQPPH